MKRVFGIILGIVFLCGVLGYALWQKGYLARWTDDRVAYYQMKLKFFPGDPGALNRLAKTLQARAEYQDAMKAYARLVELKAFGQDADPQTAKQIIEKISVLQRYYEAAIRAKPDYRDAYLNLAKFYEEIGRVPAAFSVYSELAARQPTFAETYFHLGRIYLDSADESSAIFSFQKYLELQPREESAWLTVIDVYNGVLARSPDKEIWFRARRDALQQFITLINAKTPNPDSYFNLGLLYIGMGNVPAAISALQNALDLDPRHAPTLNQLGELHLRARQSNLALGYFERAVKARPRDVNGYLNLGRVYFSMGQDDQAEKYFSEVLKVSPSNETARFSLGYLSEKRGKLRDALNHYQVVTRINPANAEGFYNLGNVQAALRNFTEAKRLYRMALQINPNHLNASVNICLLSFQQKEYEAAVKMCDNARLLGYVFPEGMEEILTPYRSGY